MENIFSRTEMLFGKENMDKLKNSKIAVFGIGGVGGYCVEALVRSGIGAIDLFDSDTVDITNINRQIIATQKTVGLPKVEVCKERCLEINPDVIIESNNIFYNTENSKNYDFSKYDYVIDAIDTVSSKIELILNAQNSNTPIISSMGTGNKVNAYMLEVSDICKTSVCPLARVMRYELKKRGVKKLKVVYSKEEPIISNVRDSKTGKNIPASNAFVPACAGLIIAGEVVKDLINS